MHVAAHHNDQGGGKERRMIALGDLTKEGQREDYKVLMVT